MIHHEIDFVLGKELEGSAFGKHAADEFVSDLNAALLIRAPRITEEDARTQFPGRQVTFKGGRVCELAAAIGQDHREQLLKERYAQFLLKAVEDVRHRSGGIGVSEKSQHQVAVAEMQGKQNL